MPAVFALQKAVLTESEVYTSVANLFENEPDLLREFSQFLPDAAGSSPTVNLSTFPTPSISSAYVANTGVIIKEDAKTTRSLQQLGSSPSPFPSAQSSHGNASSQFNTNLKATVPTSVPMKRPMSVKSPTVSQSSPIPAKVLFCDEK